MTFTRAVVRWPDGRVRQLRNVPANQILTIVPEEKR